MLYDATLSNVETSIEQTDPERGSVAALLISGWHEGEQFLQNLVVGLAGARFEFGEAGPCFGFHLHGGNHQIDKTHSTHIAFYVRTPRSRFRCGERDVNRPAVRILWRLRLAVGEPEWVHNPDVPTASRTLAGVGSCAARVEVSGQVDLHGEGDLAECFGEASQPPLLDPPRSPDLRVQEVVAPERPSPRRRAWPDPPTHEGCAFPGRGGSLKAIVPLLKSMATADPPTTITIRTSTRQLLENMKRRGETYDELIQELAEEYYPPRVIADLKRRVADIRAGRVKGIPADEMRQRLGH